MNRLIGAYCKVITREPGDKRASVTTGIIKDVDSDSGFLTIESRRGLGVLNIKTIVAIKPREK